MLEQIAFGLLMIAQVLAVIVGRRWDAAAAQAADRAETRAPAARAAPVVQA